MPFAGYKDFADCLRKNQDKKNPNAYCGSIMHAVEGKDFGVQEDPRLGSYGETNYENQTIKINPKRGDVVNTIIHERLHVENPEMAEDDVYRKAYDIESSMSMEEMSNLLSETVRQSHNGRQIHHTIVSKVVTRKVK